MGFLNGKSLVMQRHPLQARVVRRRLQLRAVSMWVNDSLDGKPGVSLRSYCRQVANEQGGNPEWIYRGITKVMKEPKVQQMIQGVCDEMASRTIKTGQSILARRIEEAGEAMDTKEVIAVVENAARLRGRAYEKQEPAGAATVAVQINLPSPVSYEPQVRVEAVAKAKDKLGDLVR